MKRKYYMVIMLVAALLGLVAFAYRYGQNRQSTAGNTASSTHYPVAQALITSALPARRTFTTRIPWIGTVETQASVELTALVAGRVEVIDAEDQRQLQKGRRVMRLGGTQIDEAHAGLTAEMKSLVTEVDLARQTVERLKKSLKTRLATRDQLAAAQDAMVEVETKLREAQVNLKTLESQMNIVAPMDGVFTDRRVSVGQNVSAGQVVGEIIDTRRLRIAAFLFPLQGIALQGKEATVRLSEDQTLTGTVRRILPKVLSSGAVALWIEGPQIDSPLRPGQTVEGDIAAEDKPDALAVPTSAIVYDAHEHPFVFVDKDGVYEPLGIRVGLVQDGWVEVISQLKEDQLVVTQGAYELFYRKFNEQFKVQD